MKYIIVSHTWEDQLTDIVNKMIKSGWKPIGGIAMTDTRNSPFVYKKVAQAMVCDE